MVCCFYAPEWQNSDLLVCQPVHHFKNLVSSLFPKSLGDFTKTSQECFLQCLEDFLLQLLRENYGPLIVVQVHIPRTYVTFSRDVSRLRNSYCGISQYAILYHNTDRFRMFQLQDVATHCSSLNQLFRHFFNLKYICIQFYK